MKKITQASFWVIIMITHLLTYQSCAQDNITKDLHFDTCVDRAHIPQIRQHLGIIYNKEVQVTVKSLFSRD